MSVTIDDVLAESGLGNKVKKSRLPARLDFIQSASGLVLALFMWGHMMLVSSILLGKDTMYFVTKFLEGKYILGKSMPILVSGAAFSVSWVWRPVRLPDGCSPYQGYGVSRPSIRPDL